MTAPSGLTSREPFAYYDPESLCWKTCQQSLPLENLSASPMTWPRAGMTSGGHALELPMLAPHTDANAYS